MDFLNRDVRDLFIKNMPFIETKPQDEAPAKFNLNANAKNVLVGSGSIINGKIINSVLFSKVYTGDNSSVKDSIIMDKSYIGNNCVIENAIIDKEVIISDEKKIIGKKGDPVIISRNCVV